VTSPTSAGTNGLIASGARLVRDAVDVLASLPPEDFARLARPVARAAEGARAVLPAEADAVLAALPPGEAVALEELAARTELRAGELLARLVALEAEGLVRRLSGGVFARA
jgi:predicted Rossmann fold nucleotide-binding protein DprA/Smf involved in DNA uptake